MFLLRLAQPGDRQAVAEMILARCEWMEQRGMPSWRPSVDDLASQCDNPYGDVWVMEAPDGRIVARTTTQTQGPPWWTDEERVEPALYLNTTVTHPDLRDHKLGTMIALWAVDRAAQLGLQWARRDCLWPGLVRYYQTQGYILVREVDRGKYRLYLLHRRAERIDVPQIRTETP